LLEEHQGIKRVPVLTEGVLDEAVVVGVAGGGEEHPVQPDPAGLVVQLVLVAVPLGNLDRDVELHCLTFLPPPRARCASSRAPAGRTVLSLLGTSLTYEHRIAVTTWPRSRRAAATWRCAAAAGGGCAVPPASPPSS